MGREKVMILISSDIEWIKMCDIYTPVNISNYYCFIFVRSGLESLFKGSGQTVLVHGREML